MRSIPSGRARTALPLVLTFAVLLGACADEGRSPTEPRSAPSLPPAPSANFTSTIDGAAGTITLFGDDGLAYVLDASRSELRVSDGTVIELSPGQLASATTAFVAALEGDQVSEALALSPPTIDPACELGLQTCGRQEAFGTGATVMPGELGAFAPMPGSPGPAFLARRTPPDGAFPLAPADGLSPLYGDGPISCRNIAVAINDASAQHRGRRTAVVAVITAAAQLRGTITDGVPRLKGVDIPSFAIRLEVAAYEQITATTQLDILASLYSAYGCWGNRWSGQVGSTFVPTAPTIAKVCHSETWYVSVDDGATWVKQEVNVCEYRMS